MIKLPDKYIGSDISVDALLEEMGLRRLQLYSLSFSPLSNSQILLR